MKPARRPEFVYFISDGENIKIGYSLWPHQRMQDLQVGHATALQMLGIMRVSSKDEEDRLHDRFLHLRVRGEWFRPGPDLLRFIARLPDPSEQQPSFAEWFSNRQATGWPNEEAERAAYFVGKYLEMQERRPLPRPMLQGLAEQAKALERAMNRTIRLNAAPCSETHSLVTAPATDGRGP
ncbi:MAG: hypothetical protein C4523_00085 [Myxococcales bacterium]|nr:MAG: hypothetical protein C4523_00085 [Myxococcales bacterium]